MIPEPVDCFDEGAAVNNANQKKDETHDDDIHDGLQNDLINCSQVRNAHCWDENSPHTDDAKWKKEHRCEAKYSEYDKIHTRPGTPRIGLRHRRLRIRQ